MNSKAYSLILLQAVIGFVIGTIAACSPTKFTSGNELSNSCNDQTQNCVTKDSYNIYNKSFKVGAGKVDILFVDDNSASMSFEQKNMAAKFGGFVEALDRKQIDYRIAITTTDLNAVSQNKLITFGNGNKFLTNSDSNRVGFFNSAIVRSETITCENYIRGIINTYGSEWRSASEYQANYSKMCPSPDERGIYTASLVLSTNAENFVRPDANLSIILISDEDVRSGNETLEANDKYDSFISMMNSKYASKYWDFNSIIVKDNTCIAIQNHEILDQQGRSAVTSSIGYEYAKISNSAARDIDNNPRPRGQILDICQSDYSQHFNAIETQISESSRLFTLACKPDGAPVITTKDGANTTVPYTWDGDRKIVFSRGSEGIEVNINYRCYVGVK